MDIYNASKYKSNKERRRERDRGEGKTKREMIDKQRRERERERDVILLHEVFGLLIFSVFTPVRFQLSE